MTLAGRPRARRLALLTTTGLISSLVILPPSDAVASVTAKGAAPTTCGARALATNVAHYEADGTTPSQPGVERIHCAAW